MPWLFPLVTVESISFHQPELAIQVVPFRLIEAAPAQFRAVVTKTLAMPEIREAMLKVGLDPIVTSQANFKEMVKSESARWAKVIKEANIQTE